MEKCDDNSRIKDTRNKSVLNKHDGPVHKPAFAQLKKMIK